MIRHIVALRFRSGVTEARKAELYAALEGLSGHIEGILDFRAFRNVSVETPLVRGFEDGFWFDFRDAAVRTVYLEDALHQAIGARIVAETEGGAEGVFVCDVEI
jgi:hypothetical protein